MIFPQKITQNKINQIDISALKQELDYVRARLEIYEKKQTNHGESLKETRMHVKNLASVLLDNTKSGETLSKELFNLAGTVTQHAEVINSIRDYVKDHVEDGEIHNAGVGFSDDDDDLLASPLDKTMATSMWKKPKGNN